MCRKLVFLLFVLALGLMTSAQAKTIIWVSDNKANSAPAADQGWVDLLRNNGHTVDYKGENPAVNRQYWRTLDAGKIAELNAADLIIVSRDTDSGNYASNAQEVLDWNLITTPLILQVAHIYRNNRWIWLNSTDVGATTAPLLAVMPEHPIFNGVNLAPGNQVQILTSQSSVGDGTVDPTNNYTLIATRSDAGADGVWIATWEPDVEFYPGSGQTPAGPRMYFGSGGTVDTTDGTYNLTAEGEKLFLNAVAYMSGYVQVKATNPAPGKGEMIDADSVLLQWTPGGLAAMHDVYCSTSFDDVNTATTSSGDVYKGRQIELKYPFDPLDPFATMPVTRGETYYWRIDEVNDLHADKLWRGDIWSFEVLSDLNWGPTPAHQATYVPVTTDLSWRKGNLAKKGHFVYLSTDFNAVNNVAPGTITPGVPPYLGVTSPETVTTIPIPGDLLYNTKYYWRADVVESTPPPKAYKGEVWSFTTGPPGVGMILREIWQGMTVNPGAAISLLYDWPDFPYNPTITDTLTSFVSDPDWDDYGGRIHGWLYAPVSGDYRFYLTSDDNGELWLSTDEDPANAQLIASESGSRALYNWVSTGEEASVPITLVGDKKYYISALWKERGGGDHCAVGWTGPGISTITVIPGNVLMPFVQYWAWDPIPLNEASNVSAATTIDWLEGRYAASHNVYFGTSYADVKAGTGGTFKGSQLLGNHAYDPPGALEAGKAYFWKIDEVNDLHPDHKWEGPVWAFRVADGAGGLLGAYYQHTGDASPAGFETFKLSRIDPEINFNWGAGSPDPLVDVNDFSCRWTGQLEVPVSEDYTFYTLVDDGERLWIDGQLIIDQWIQGATPEYASVPIPLVAGQKYDIRMEQYENEGGATAYLRWSSPSTPKRIIPPMWLWPPTKASNPVPPDGSTTAPPQQPTLSWTAGVYAAAVNGHRVYFDADEAKVIARAGCQVNNVSTTNPSYLLPYTFGLKETYYWAVDEVNGVTWPGDVWSFTTANNKVIDDMETYTDWQIAGNNIVDAWTDGIGDCESTGNGTGSTIYDYPTFSFGGVKSMKYDYDNDGMAYNPCTDKEEPRTYKYSKIVAQVANLPSGIGSDWAAGGARALSLRFWGDPNTTVIEPMWVELTDWSGGHAKVTYGDYIDEDPNDIAEAAWHEWLIDLDDFTGVNVSNVKSITIGIGLEDDIGPYGSGRLYFDEIRLYAPKCVLTRRSADFAAFDYAPAGNPAGDCVIDYRELELMTQDWLLNDYNVTGDANLINFPTDNSQWVAGKKNNALNFDGINDNVYAQRIYLPRSAFSVAMWINPRIDLGPTTRRMDLIYWGVGNRPHLTFNKAEGTAGAIGLWPNTGAADFNGPLTVTTSWTANTWYHIVATFDGTDFKIYANGALEGTVNQPGTHSAASGPRIGSNNAGANNFDGRIDDFRIYNYALSSANVLSLLNSAEPPVGPLFWFKFDETSGDIAHESMGTLIYVPLPRPAIDLYGDGIVNFKDYAVLVTRWLEEVQYP